MCSNTFCAAQKMIAALPENGCRSIAVGLIDAAAAALAASGRKVTLKALRAAISGGNSVLNLEMDADDFGSRGLVEALAPFKTVTAAGIFFNEWLFTEALAPARLAVDTGKIRDCSCG